MKTLRPTGRLSLAFLALVLGPMFALLEGCSFTTTVTTVPSHRYALVIGVQDYPDYPDPTESGGTASSDLTYTDDDAVDMAAALTASGWTVTKKLISSADSSLSGYASFESPTYDAIKTAIANFATLVGSDKDASVLVYYSGHGSISSDSSTVYMIPYDGLLTTSTQYTYYGQTYYFQDDDLSKWITPATMTSWLAAVPAKNKLLILDSCYSGGFVTTDSAVDLSPAAYGITTASTDASTASTSDKSAIATALAKMGSLISANLENYGSTEVTTLSAAGSGESSFDGTASMANGVFTYYLLQAAASGDSDGDGVVTMNEAYIYAKNKVKSLWDQQYSSASFLPHLSGGTGDVGLFN